MNCGKKKTLLAIFAYPDDEAFGTDSAMARCATARAHMAMVAARGVETLSTAPLSPAVLYARHVGRGRLL